MEIGSLTASANSFSEPKGSEEDGGNNFGRILGFCPPSFRKSINPSSSVYGKKGCKPELRGVKSICLVFIKRCDLNICRFLKSSMSMLFVSWSIRLMLVIAHWVLCIICINQWVGALKTILPYLKPMAINRCIRFCLVRMVCQ